MGYQYLRAPRPAAAPSAARQPGPVTMALRAMLSTVTTPLASGPVTDAIRTMRAAEPGFDANPDLRALRRALAERIEADIAALDMLGGDPDLESSLADWTVGSNDDREEENEHGGDVQDEPHDEEEDDDRDSGCGDPAGAFEQYGGPVGAWGAFT